MLCFKLFPVETKLSVMPSDKDHANKSVSYLPIFNSCSDFLTLRTLWSNISDRIRIRNSENFYFILRLCLLLTFLTIKFVKTRLYKNWNCFIISRLKINRREQK